VFDHWRTLLNHPTAKLDDKRRRTIRAALKAGYGVDQLLTAIDGCANSPWHMGKNDRQTVFDGLELILRDAAHIDKFIRLASTPPPDDHDPVAAFVRQGNFIEGEVLGRA
jgi:hypothetical protein